MGVDGDEGRGADVGVNDLVVEADTNALNDDVVGNRVERCEVVNGVRPLLDAHRRLPIHGWQDDEGVGLKKIVGEVNGEERKDW